MPETRTSSASPCVTARLACCGASLILTGGQHGQRVGVEHFEVQASLEIGAARQRHFQRAERPPDQVVGLVARGTTPPASAWTRVPRSAVSDCTSSE